MKKRYFIHNDHDWQKGKIKTGDNLRLSIDSKTKKSTDFLYYYDYLPGATNDCVHSTDLQVGQQAFCRLTRTTFSAKVSVYDNNVSINGIRKEKYTLVKNPLRTKMSTMSSAHASKSLLGGGYMQQYGSTVDPEQVLKDLK